jgi:hypothetical protein
MPVGFLEEVLSIRLEYHQVHKAFSNSVNLSVVYRRGQNVDPRFQPSLMIFVAQVMKCELVFETIRSRVGFLVICYT